MLYLCLGRGAGRSGLPLVRATARGTSATRSNGFRKKALLRGEKALLGVKTRSNAFQNPSNGGRATAGSCRAAIRFVNIKPPRKRCRRLKTLKSGPAAAAGQTTARQFRYRRKAEKHNPHKPAEARPLVPAASPHTYTYIFQRRIGFFSRKRYIFAAGVRLPHSHGRPAPAQQRNLTHYTYS